MNPHPTAIPRTWLRILLRILRRTLPRPAALPRLFCAALLAAAAGAEESPPAAVAPPFPASADLVYATSGTFRLGGMPLTLHARTTTHWQLSAGAYEASLHTDTIGFDQLSHGSLRAGGGLAPARYTERRPFHDPENVDIDWPQATIRYGAAAAVAGPAAGAQDRLSLQFELAALYRQHPERFGAGAVFAVQLIGTHAIDDWKFVSAGEETVETGRGPMRAVHLGARRPVRDTEETMDLWLAPAIHQLPVRIRMVDRNQAVIDSLLQSAAIP